MAITFEEFKDQATILLKINLSGYKLKRVQRRTDSLMRRYNIDDYNQCLNLLKNDQKFKEAYLNHFTINTSEFFRNPNSFTYLKDKIFPELISKNNKIKIWSAPCSNGSEPYTIALILHEMGVKPFQFEILASDIDAEILEAAKTAIYGPNSLKNVPAGIMKKYFTLLPGTENKYQLSREIMQQVKFEKKDLINETYRQNWDLILSRNFFIYLTREIKDELTKKFISVLKPEGYLFLGNTEFIFNPEQFGLKKEYLAFYKKEV